MSRASSQDNFFAYIAAAVVIVLAAAVLFGWKQLRPKHDAVSVAYTKFGPYQLENQNTSIAAKLSVQTTEENASWPESNRKNLNILFQKLLSEADMQKVRAPNGLKFLQDWLTSGCNTTFHTNYVQAVLLTDFVFEDNGPSS